eukprot:scaffold1220_cov259-Pinguiococcus_pyrenoidosus.AAC.140
MPRRVSSSLRRLLRASAVYVRMLSLAQARIVRQCKLVAGSHVHVAKVSRSVPRQRLDQRFWLSPHVPQLAQHQRRVRHEGEVRRDQSVGYAGPQRRAKSGRVRAANLKSLLLHRRQQVRQLGNAAQESGAGLHLRALTDLRHQGRDEAAQVELCLGDAALGRNLIKQSNSPAA